MSKHNPALTYRCFLLYTYSMNQEQIRFSIQTQAEFRFSRSGGPGGQNVNKVSTKVQLIIDPARIEGLSPEERLGVRDRLSGRMDSEGNLTITVDEERSQARNREIAIDRLTALVSAAARPQKKRIPTRATRASKLRSLAQKKLRSLVKRGRSTPHPED